MPIVFETWTRVHVVPPSSEIASHGKPQWPFGTNSRPALSDAPWPCRLAAEAARRRVEAEVGRAAGRA